METTNQERRKFLKYTALAGVGTAVALANARDAFAHTSFDDTSVETDTLIAPTGRAASIMIAASDSNWRSKNQADYVCTGVDDDVILNVALNAATNGDFILAEGTYNISNTITINRPISIHGMGNAVFNCNQSGTEAAAIVFKYTDDANITTTLTADVAANATDITLASVSWLNPGDLIVMYNTTVWSPDFTASRVGELYRVKAINGNVVTLNEPLCHAYTASTTTVKTAKPITVKLDNITFIGRDSTSLYQGVYIYYGVDVNITRCRFNNHGLAAIALRSCYNVNISGCHISNCNGSGYGYGVDILNMCSYVSITGNDIISCRHCVTAGSTFSSSAPGLNRNIIVDGNNIVGLLDTHGMVYDFTVTNNIIYGGSGAIVAGCQHLICANNKCYFSGANPHFVAPREILSVPRTIMIENNMISHGSIYEDDEVSPMNVLKICGNIIENGEGASGMNAIYYAPGATTCNDIIIKDNVCRHTEYNGIYVNITALTSPVTVDISGNDMNETLRAGIRLDCNAANVETNVVSVQRNIVTNANMNGGATYAGITMTNVKYAPIIGNKVTDNHNYGGQGIVTGAGCDYNLVSLNVVKGMTGTKLALTGANNVTEHNLTI